MKMRDVILTASSNLRRSKVRTFLTVSAVFMGAFTLMLTTGVGEGLKKYVDEQVGSVGAKDALFITPVNEAANPFGGEAQEYDPNRVTSSATGFNQVLLNKADLDKILALPEITEITPLYPTSPDYIMAAGKKYVATLGQTIDGLIQPMRSGRMVNQDGRDFEVTLPPEYVGPLGFANDNAAIGQTLTIGLTDALGQPFTMQAKIVGVQEKALINGNSTTGNISLIEAIAGRVRQGLSEAQKEQYPNAFAKFDSNISDQQLQDLKRKLEDMKYDAQTLDDQLGVINQIIDGVITFLNIFAGIALAAASFGIVNTLLMAVQERTREIGLMKALGMGRKKIFTLFSLEAILIGFWGAIIALGAANIVGRIGSNWASRTIFKDFEGLSLFSFPFKSMVPIILGIMLIAFLAATLPARRASRLDPIEALRYE